jgi:quinol monooxygenase YgiN
MAQQENRCKPHGFVVSCPESQPLEGAIMTRISKDFDGQTVICTFDVTPGSAQDVIDALTEAYAEVISRQPGYVSGAIHLNDAQTRIATYSQWRDRRDYQAMLRTPEMRDRNRAIHAMCRHFEPVMYDVVDTWQR